MARGDVRIVSGQTEFRPSSGETWLLYKIFGDLENWEYFDGRDYVIAESDNKVFVNNSAYIRKTPRTASADIYQAYIQWS